MRPNVERPSNLVWARVERDVFARLDASHDPGQSAVPLSDPRWRWSIALSTAASILALLIAVSRSRDAVDRARGETWSRVVAGDAPSTVAFDGAYVVVDANSELVVQRTRAAPLAWAERGSAWFTVAPRARSSPFRVLAGDVVVRATAGVFRVSRDDRQTAVAVAAGSVDVQAGGAITAVRTGSRWTSAAR
jgi:transmembrane sensor